MTKPFNASYRKIQTISTADIKNATLILKSDIDGVINTIKGQMRVLTTFCWKRKKKLAN